MVGKCCPHIETMVSLVHSDMAASLGLVCNPWLCKSNESRAFITNKQAISVCSRKTSGIATCSLIKDPPLPATSTPTGWATFMHHASGEWNGYSADFDHTGKPLELPTSVVPEAYRDWGVEVFDWQTQCPTLAKEPTSFLRKNIRLYPTVGCEADAATIHSVEEKVTSGSGFFAYHSSGSYAAVWRKETNKTTGIFWEIEHCLVHEGPKKIRTRLLQQLNIGENLVPCISGISVYREEWDSPFRNGESLGVCSATGSAFAVNSPLQASELHGLWHAQKFRATNDTALDAIKCPVKELHLEGTERFERILVEEDIFLPEGLWSRLKVLEKQHFSVEAGWLIHFDKAIVSTILLSNNGEVVDCLLSFEQRDKTGNEL